MISNSNLNKNGDYLFFVNIDESNIKIGLYSNHNSKELSSKDIQKLLYDIK